MTLRKIIWCLFWCAWNALRICAALLLSIYLIPVINGLYESEAWRPRERLFIDPIVCGKIAGQVYEFPRVYFPFWPDYEGRSSFDSGFAENKQGCDANLVSVFLSMTWLALAPANDSLVFRQGLEHEGLLVSFSPVVGKQGDLRNTLNILLEASQPGSVNLAVFEESSGLYSVRGRDRLFTRNEQLFYWEGPLESLSSVGFCSWRPRMPHYYSCKMTYIHEGGVLVEVIMLPARLKYWSRIKELLNDCLANSRKAG